MRRWMLAVLMLAAAANVSTIASGADLSTPKNAAASLFAAVGAGDVAGVRAVLYSPGPQQAELTAARAKLIVSGKKFIDAIHAKFGDAADAMTRGMADFPAPAAVNDAKVEQSGDQAKVTIPGQPRPMEFRRQGGQWHLVVSELADAAPESIAKQTQIVQLMADAMQTCADEIAAGNYKTSDAAINAIQQRLQNVMLKFQRPSTTRATTEPATASCELKGEEFLATDGAQMNTDKIQFFVFICVHLCPICG